MNPQIIVPKDRIASFCQERGIDRLAIFGSALGAQFGPDSDLDVLVEFDPHRIPGLMGMAPSPFVLSEATRSRRVEAGDGLPCPSTSLHSAALRVASLRTNGGEWPCRPSQLTGREAIFKKEKTLSEATRSRRVEAGDGLPCPSTSLHFAALRVASLRTNG